MMNIKEVLFQSFINFLMKNLVALLKIKIFPIKNLQKNYTNQLLENIIKESAFIDKHWGAYLADTQLKSKF